MRSTKVCYICACYRESVPLLIRFFLLSSSDSSQRVGRTGAPAAAVSKTQLVIQRFIPCERKKPECKTVVFTSSSHFQLKAQQAPCCMSRALAFSQLQERAPASRGESKLKCDASLGYLSSRRSPTCRKTTQLLNIVG